jgi:hypothetical protein
MATELTDEEVKQLEEEFREFLPPEASLADVEIAPKVERLAFAGTSEGMLLLVGTGAAGRRTLFMNPIVARTLMEGVAEAGEVHKWWPELKDGQIPLAPDLTRTDLEEAELVRSLRTVNVPDGLLAVCGSEGGIITFFLRPNFAAAIACTVDKIGKQAEWWDPDYAVLPKIGNLV